jgi:hypothetical protein
MINNKPNLTEPSVLSLEAEIRYLEKEFLNLTIRLFHLEYHGIHFNGYTPPDYVLFSFESNVKN